LHVLQSAIAGIDDTPDVFLRLHPATSDDDAAGVRWSTS